VLVFPELLKEFTVGACPSAGRNGISSVSDATKLLYLNVKPKGDTNLDLCVIKIVSLKGSRGSGERAIHDIYCHQTEPGNRIRQGAGTTTGPCPCKARGSGMYTCMHDQGLHQKFMLPEPGCVHADDSDYAPYTFKGISIPWLKVGYVSITVHRDGFKLLKVNSPVG